MADLVMAVVGYGYWGANHLRALQRRSDVTSVVVDSDAARREAAVAAFPGLRAVASLDELHGEIDAAVICTPPGAHRDLGIQAMRLGAHVLIEKPMATSAEECAALIAVAEECDRVLMVGHTYDYNAVVDDLARRVQADELGTIRYLDSARLSVGGYRRDVNVMWDMAPHDIVIMRRVLNAWPNRIAAWSMDHSGEGVDDIAMLRLDFDGLNTVGYVRVSWLDPVKVRRLSIVGSDKIAVFNESTPSETPVRIVHASSEPRLGAGSTHPLPPGYAPELITEPYIEQWEPLARQLEHFVHCIRTGSQPRTDGLEGMRVVEILEAADLSARTGQPVELDFQDDLMVAR